MDKTAISNRLRALAADSEKRSTIAQLRDVYDDVEAALEAGVKRTTIVEELAKLGIVMTLATFDSNLKRIRAKKVRAPKQHPLGKTEIDLESSNKEARIEPSAERAANTSHDPADLNHIMGSTPDLAALARKAKKRSS